jgi:hypothetical protein
LEVFQPLSSFVLHPSSGREALAEAQDLGAVEVLGGTFAGAAGGLAAAAVPFAEGELGLGLVEGPEVEPGAEAALAEDAPLGAEAAPAGVL